MLSQKQMAGRRNGQEFGDPLDDSKKGRSKPVTHNVGALRSDGAEPLFLFAKQRRKKRLFLQVALPDLKLAQDGLPGEENFVPRGFHVAQGGLGAVAQVADRGDAGDQGDDFIPAGRGAFDTGHDRLQFLDDDRFDFQKLALVLGREPLGARQADKAVQLLPTLEVILEPDDQLVEVLVLHIKLSFFGGGIQSFRRQKDNGAAAQFSGCDLQDAIMHDKLIELQLRLTSALEAGQHLGANGPHAIHGKTLGKSRGQDLALRVDREGAAGQLVQFMRELRLGENV